MNYVFFIQGNRGNPDPENCNPIIDSRSIDKTSMRSLAEYAIRTKTALNCYDDLPCKLPRGSIIYVKLDNPFCQPRFF